MLAGWTKAIAIGGLLALWGAVSSGSAQAADDNPQVLFKTTKGDVVIELYEDKAPNTVANFISLVEKKFYDGLTFHRVLDGFMAQGGDPKGTGSGGPGYSIACECYRPDAEKHVRGSLSMAHAGRDTGGSQFFITFGETSHLDGKHTVFGRVVKGMDVVDKFQRIDPNRPSGVKPDRILEARVIKKRDHEYKPKTLPERG
jgi:cyclophilin family peptidyl-prolyl cis-trans isomerase